MPFTQTIPNRKEIDLHIPVITTLIIVLFLFYIDEGYYNFNWMTEWGNWVVFGIYFIIFFPLQWLLARYIFRKFKGISLGLAMLLIGIPITLAIFFWLVS